MPNRIRTEAQRSSMRVWIPEIGVGIGVTALGAAFLVVPAGTPLLGGVPTPIALGVFALGLFLIALSALTFVVERLRHPPEPRLSAQWEAHLEDMKQFSLRVASATNDYRDLWDEEIRHSLSIHFPEKGQCLVTYQQAVRGYSDAERALLEYCIVETPKIGVANVSGSITKALVHWGTEFADGHDPTQEAHAFLGGTDALRERKGRSDAEQQAYHQWLDDYLAEFKQSPAVCELGLALRSRFTSAIAAGNVWNDLKPIHRVPGPRCPLCEDYPA